MKKDVYVVISFEKDKNGQSFPDRVVGVYTTAKKANEAYYKSDKFCTIIIKELDKLFMGLY